LHGSAFNTGFNEFPETQTTSALYYNSFLDDEEQPMITKDMVGAIWIRNLTCSGVESRVLDCERPEIWGVDFCGRRGLGYVSDRPGAMGVVCRNFEVAQGFEAPLVWDTDFEETYAGAYD
jgi:hypothetical protein